MSSYKPSKAKPFFTFQDSGFEQPNQIYVMGIESLGSGYKLFEFNVFLSF